MSASVAEYCINTVFFDFACALAWLITASTTQVSQTHQKQVLKIKFHCTNRQASLVCTHNLAARLWCMIQEASKSAPAHNDQSITLCAVLDSAKLAWS